MSTATISGDLLAAGGRLGDELRAMLSSPPPLHVLCERDRLMKAAVTLDGREAHITGRSCRFATVWSVQADAVIFRRVEFAWPTVQYVVDHHDGAFRS